MQQIDENHYETDKGKIRVLIGMTVSLVDCKAGPCETDNRSTWCGRSDN